MSLPSNVSTEFEDYCEGCPYVELKIESATLYEGNSALKIQNTVCCENRNLCKRLYERFERNRTRFQFK